MATVPMMGLDQAPPLPPDLAMTQAPPEQQASLGNMVGDGGNQKAVIERAMMVEQMVRSLAQMLPGFSSAADQITQILRMGVVQAMQGAPSPAIPQGGMGMGMMT